MNTALLVGMAARIQQQPAQQFEAKEFTTQWREYVTEYGERCWYCCNGIGAIIVVLKFKI